MAYKDNWRHHFWSGYTGQASKELEQDFWKEDLDDPAIRVRYRWLKWLWVSFASAATSIGFSTAVLFYVVGNMTLKLSVLWIGALTISTTLLLFLNKAVHFWIDYRKYKGSERRAE
jgi:hypothetical protein